MIRYLYANDAWPIGVQESISAEQQQTNRFTDMAVHPIVSKPSNLTIMVFVIIFRALYGRSRI